MSETSPPTNEETASTEPAADVIPKKRSTMVNIFLRGLAFVLPSILTLVILLWIGGAIYDYIINPVSSFVRFTIAQTIDESQPTNNDGRWDKLPSLDHHVKGYWIKSAFRTKLKRKLAENPDLTEVPRKWIDDQLEVTRDSRHSADLFSPQIFVPMGNRSIPYVDYEEVAQRIPAAQMPTTSTGIYMELVTSRYFISLFHLSAVSILLAVIFIYFAGRFASVRIGAWVVHKFETGILGRLPVIRNVYGSVKQVTDFLFTERTIEYNRVVAIEYPRKGIWALAFVTGDSLLEITAAAGEPMVSVLVPSSPMPVTGYTMSIPRSEILDLNISIDQTFQFTISCGVLVPPQQKITAELLQKEITKRLATQTAGFDLIKDKVTLTSAETDNQVVVESHDGEKPDDEQKVT